MCGIIGIVGNQPVDQRLVRGLEKLEYRGYDSSGIATIFKGKIQRYCLKLLVIVFYIMFLFFDCYFFW